MLSCTISKLAGRYLDFDVPRGMAIGGLAGAGAGALSGSLVDIGIDDNFVKQLGATVPAWSSALFVLVKGVTEDKVPPEIVQFKPRVLRASLSNEAEARLKAALEKGSSVVV